MDKKKLPGLLKEFGLLTVGTAIIAFAVFCMVRGINAMHAKAEALKKKEEEEAAAAAEPPAPPAEPEPTKEELLLTEIRDLLKNK